MQFSEKLPPRKRKPRANPITDDPAFGMLVKTMRDGVPSACLTLTPEDIRNLKKIKFPERMATDSVRRIIAAEHLPYRVAKYKTDDGGWAVAISRIIEEPSAQKKDRPKRDQTEETAKSA